MISKFMVIRSYILMHASCDCLLAFKALFINVLSDKDN